MEGVIHGKALNWGTKFPQNLKPEDLSEPGMEGCIPLIPSYRVLKVYKGVYALSKTIRRSMTPSSTVRSLKLPGMRLVSIC